MTTEELLIKINQNNSLLKTNLNFENLKQNQAEGLLLKICDIGLMKYRNNFYENGEYKVELYLEYINKVKNYLYKYIYMKDIILLDDIIGLHDIIMVGLKNENNNNLGKLRSIPIVTKEKTYLKGLSEAFISHYKVDKKTNESLDIFNNEIENSKEKIEQITKLYIQFLAKIHIFEDGNGRIMFILLDSLLFKYNYLPIFIRYHEEKRDKISEDYIKHRNINKLQNDLFKIIIDIYQKYQIK